MQRILRSRTRTALARLAAAGLTALVAALVPGAPGAAPAAVPPQTGQTGQVGGTYRGPGDTVPNGTPPGDTGGGGPTAPGPLGPGPGDSVPPGGPAAGGPTTTGDGPLAAPPIPPGLPETGLDPTSPTSPGNRPRAHSETSWQLWWHYNRWAFVDPRGGEDLLAASASGDFYLGRGQKFTPDAVRRPSPAQRAELVLPALTQAVYAGGRAEFCIATAHALAKLRQAPPEGSTLAAFPQAIEPRLSAKNALIAEKAMVFLGAYGDPSSWVTLASILQSTPDALRITGTSRVPWRWRAHAAYGLGLLGERNVHDQALAARLFKLLLRVYLVEEEPEVRVALALSATRLGVPHRERRSVSEAAAVERTEQLRTLLDVYRRESDLGVRAQLAPALGAFAADMPTWARAQVVEVLLESVGKRKKSPAQLQFGCVSGLGLLVRAGEAEVDRDARKELLRIAFKSGTPRGTRFLARAALAQALGRPGEGDDPWAGVEEARRALVRALGRERGESLGWTALAVGILERSAYDRETTPNAHAMRVLRDAVEDERSPDAAPALALALGLAGDQESLPLLVSRLYNAKSDEQRGYFALALGLVGAQDARDLLRDTLIASSNQPFALEQTSIALALLGDGSAGEALLGLLDTASNPAVQASLASSIGWSRDPALLEPLVQRLSDPRRSDVDRAWTAVAIGRIVDEDRWPWHGEWCVGTNYTGDVPSRIEPDYRTGLLDLW